MKRLLFYISAIMAVLSGCSTSDESIPSVSYMASGNTVGVNVIAPTVTSDTRGTGTVGSTNAAENQWSGQRLRVYMFNKGTLTPTQIENEAGYPESIFENAEVFAPKGVAVGPISRRNNLRSYYPINGASDFWGYRTDGAETDMPTSNGTQMSIPFRIDGSQDIMAGMTSNIINPSEDTPYLYSAKSAREGHIPTLEFKHMLTRLTFAVKAYEDNVNYSQDAPLIDKSLVRNNEISGLIAKDAFYTCALHNISENNKISLGIFIDSIMIESPSTGTLVFAFTPEATQKEQYIDWDMGSKKTLRLQERTSASVTEDLKPLSMTLAPVNTFKRIGEALLVAPAERYGLRIATHQYVERYPDTKQSYIRQEALWPSPGMPPYIIDLSGKPGHGQAGYSYNIQLGISGLEAIILNGMLTDWNWQEGNDAEKDIE